jgi:hypothetical protein
MISSFNLFVNTFFQNFQNDPFKLVSQRKLPKISALAPNDDIVIFIVCQHPLEWLVSQRLSPSAPSKKRRAAMALPNFIKIFACQHASQP